MTLETILIYGSWPDPRSSGISSVVHDMIAGLNRSGYNIVLVSEGYDAKDQFGPGAIYYMDIPADKAFRWEDAVANLQRFSGFNGLIEYDRLMEKSGRSRLKNAKLFHNIFDDLIPHYIATDRHPNDFHQLLNYVEEISGGSRPLLTRTRFNEVHEGLARFNALTGLTWEKMSDQERMQYMYGGIDLQPIVMEHVSKNREKLKEKYHFSDEYLDNATNHVWWVTHAMRQWREEAQYADRIFFLTEQDAISARELTVAGKENYHKFQTLMIGSSFQPPDRNRVDSLVKSYSSRSGLRAYRAGEGEKASIEFKPDDKKIVFVGRAHHSKGIFELAESLKILYHSGNKNVRGIFVGDFDENIRRELSSIDPDHAKEYMLFTGKVDNDELAAIYKFGDVTAIPSHNEGFNLVGIESLKMGTPVVVTDSSGPGDVYIRHPRKMGYDIALPVNKPSDPDIAMDWGVDVDSLTTQLRKIINDPDLASRLAAAGKAFVEREYSQAAFGERQHNSYRGLLDAKKGGDKSRRSNDGKTHVMFYCHSKENTHGVPVVMNNIGSRLERDSKFKVSYVINSFDNNDIRYFDTNGKERVFRNRREFVEFLRRNRIKPDVLHSHTWHMGDHYKPFHSGRDSMKLDEFLSAIGSPKFVYTDHANPTFDLERIGKYHPRIDYSRMSDPEKLAFLFRNVLGQGEKSWEALWQPTSILDKRQLMQKADVITYVSPTQMREEESMVPGYNFGKKARVVLNGIDTERYNTSETRGIAIKKREALGISQTDKVVLYAGRMSEEKGIYDLAKAAQIMYNQGQKVVLIYQNGKRNAEAERKIKGLAPDVRVLYTDPISAENRQEMAAMYALADVVAQPTHGECFNQITAESIAMSTPVVVSDISATGDIYVKGGVAVGSKPKDPNDLAEKLIHVLSGPEELQEMMRKGKELIRSQLNIQSMVTNYIDIYTQLLK